MRDLLEQLTSSWNESTVTARATMVVSVLVLLGMIVGVGVWSSRPQYISLASGLSPSEAAEIVSKLESRNIKYRLNFAGSTVMVDKSDWNSARMFVGDVASFSGRGPELENSMITDPETNRFRMRGRLEESLERTIRNMTGIANASVHLAIAEKSVFVRERGESTASVVLELKGNASFSREQALSVVSLVSGSVEGLDPHNVSVMDTRGRFLSNHSSASDNKVATNFEFQRQFESELASKANTMLAHLLGPGRAVVRVSASLDFTCLERTKTTYDPKQKVARQEESTTIEKSGTNSSSGGLAGTKSNLGSSGQSSSQSPSKESEETISTFYETPKTVDIVKQCPGDIKRLTVAVLADLSNLSDPEAGTPSQVTQENVAAIVKQAVGFDDTRGDQIEVLITGFATQVEEAPVAPGFQWEPYKDLIRNSSLGLAALVAMVLGLMTLRKMRPVTIAIDADDDADEEQQMLFRLTERIQDNPEAMSTIISAWLSEPGEERESSKAA